MKKILLNVVNKWYVFAAIIASSIGVSSYATELINKPRNEETFSFFICSPGCDSKNLKKYLNDYYPSYLRETKIHHSDISSGTFDTLYTAYGRENADLVILPESKIDLENVTYYYLPLNTDVIVDYFSGKEFYEDNSTNKYGVKVRSKNAQVNGLITYSSEFFDEDYYMFFPRKSLHTKGLSNASYNTSLIFADVIINL